MTMPRYEMWPPQKPTCDLADVAAAVAIAADQQNIGSLKVWKQGRMNV